MNEEKKTDSGKIVLIIAICLRSIGILFGLAYFVFLFFMVGLSILSIGSHRYSNFIKLGDYETRIRNFETGVYSDYDEYSRLFHGAGLYEEDFEYNDYFIFEMPYDQCSEIDVKPDHWNIDDDTLYISVTYQKSCRSCGLSYVYYALRIDDDMEFDDYHFEYSVTNPSKKCPYDYVVDKPLISIYPTKDMNVEVKLGYPNLLTTTYPKYEKSWNVFAHTNGDLEYNGRTYYGLYWEGKSHVAKVEKDGFVVKGEDTTKFLEEKLEILGLNEREINEFIIYWLPKMEHNNYNYIRFETKEEIDKYMPLEVTPEPDTVIRVYMNFKGLDEEIEVDEQDLEETVRSGYTVVEWGGSEINE